MHRTRLAGLIAAVMFVAACTQSQTPTTPSRVSPLSEAADAAELSAASTATLVQNAAENAPASTTSLIGRFEVTDVVYAALRAPTNLIATVTGSTVSLRWTASPDPLVVNYMIEVGNAPGLANLGQFPSFGTTFEGAAPNGTYYVRVRSVDAQGALSQNATNEVVVTVTPSGNPPLTFAPPPALVGVVGTPFFYSFCGLPPGNGQNCAGIPGVLFGGVGPYHFQLDTFGGFPPIGLVLAPNGALSGTPKGVIWNHQFRVCAVDTTGTNRCPLVTITIGPRETPPCTAPLAPTGVTAAANGTTVSLNWSRSEGATSYVIEAGTSPGAADVFNSDVGDVNSLTAPSVPEGRFYIRIRAKGPCGTSEASSEVSVTVQGSVPPGGGSVSPLTLNLGAGGGCSGATLRGTLIVTAPPNVRWSADYIPNYQMRVSPTFGTGSGTVAVTVTLPPVRGRCNDTWNWVWRENIGVSFRGGSKYTVRVNYTWVYPH